MSDAADNLAVVLLRRIDTRVERLGEDMVDVKQRLTSVERQIGALRVDMAGFAARMDRADVRMDRIERRLDLTDA